MFQFSSTASLLATSALAFAAAFLVSGSATQHAQAGAVTHFLYVTVLLAGVLSLGGAGLNVVRQGAAEQSK